MNSNQVFSRIWEGFDDGEIMTACAWCGRVRLDGAWLRPPRAIFDAIDAQLAFSHTICDECVEVYSSTPPARSSRSAPSRVAS